MTSASPSACPDARQLEGILLGLVALSDEDAARLEKHLTECPRCNGAAQSVASRSDLPAVQASSTALQQMMGRMKELAGARATPAPEATVASDAPAAAGPAVDCAFLAPPQAAGEVGRLGAYRILKVVAPGGMGAPVEA